MIWINWNWWVFGMECKQKTCCDTLYMLLLLYRRKRYCVHWNCDEHCSWEWSKFKLKFSKMNALNVRLQMETDKKTHISKMHHRLPKRVNCYKQVCVHGLYYFSIFLGWVQMLTPFFNPYIFVYSTVRFKRTVGKLAYSTQN